MLFGYELDALLRHRENRSQVADILTVLESDLINDQLLEYRAELINRLLDIGEDSLYGKVKKREEEIRKSVERFT
ncbi:hypothetical protein [Mahella australiensis]|uniref:Uncharacterized protein n=1 Tax=Mahella australiensis (strain DSM 15567 / CIP 107919 / 50-1 BON) TaxID=697281 RepID=F4A0M2_MAHA5|nr:hypothetical protein [Mahella australiensis]AEE95901.1 hypothetical protein Mahau_0699 [Mahella australiensis 50-1 BON]